MNELIRYICGGSFITLPVTVAFTIYSIRVVKPVGRWLEVPIVALVLHGVATLGTAAIVGWIYLACRLFG